MGNDFSTYDERIELLLLNAKVDALVAAMNKLTKTLDKIEKRLPRRAVGPL